ncbi:hypothetical protein ElyMa_002873200 [Elysia marginata]|uniref:Uncharacterized protein n=1 Tax=Elysia marginata TaxID=1093978 RepID=A0AAV4HX98_9GAST|nr:hypothetical protein ElyMa_002873200 [Elysia marginata]
MADGLAGPVSQSSAVKPTLPMDVDQSSNITGAAATRTNLIQLPGTRDQHRLLPNLFFRLYPYGNSFLCFNLIGVTRDACFGRQS